MSDYSVVGKRLPRVDAVSKATGKALYAADFSLPDMLYGKILWSTCAHARIISLDVSGAQALEGVKAVITAHDLPPEESTKEFPNPMTSCMAKDKVIFAGQPVAAVAATDPHIAEEAISLIKVNYEELPAVIDIADAIKPDAPLVHPDTYTANLPEKGAKPGNIFWYSKNTRGDIEAGFKEADVVLENTYRTQLIHQGFLEPRASMAGVDKDGNVTLWTDNQGIFETRELIAGYLKIPMNRIKVIPVEIGGAFGGKSVQVISPICVLLSGKSGRPVKIVTTREETLKTNRPAPPSAITIKLGATRDGRLTAASATMIFDYGALYGLGGMDVVPFGSFTALSTYRIPNFSVECFDVYTNKTPTGPYRGPTAVQAAFPMESQMDMLARELNLDPLEFRLKNAPKEGDLMALGMPFPRIGFIEVIERLQLYLAKKEKPEGKNRGRGIACGFWAPGGGAAGADIFLNEDGTVSILVGSVDVSGSKTALAQIAAEELGIPYDSVSITTGDSNSAPFSMLSAGSMVTRSLANPVYQACQDIKEQLLKRAAGRLNAAINDLEYVKGRVRLKNNPDKFAAFAELAHGAAGHNAPMDSPIYGRGIHGGFANSPVFTAASADVEVDEETGKVKVLSFALVQDIGCAINPTLVEGQIQGAAAQGIGWALLENYIFKKGVMQNASLLDYREPTALDVPSIDAMTVEVPFDISPFGLRGAGEPPMVPTVAAIANAIYSAAGIRLTETPMDQEAVLKALKEKNGPAKK